MISLLNILAAEEPNGKFLPGDVNEFYWSSLAFLVVFAVMAWKLFPLAAKGLRAKADRVEDELAAAEKAQADADAEVETLMAKLGNAEADAAEILEDAGATAQKLKVDAAAKAAADADALKARTMADIDGARAHATADLRSELAAQALAAAEAVARENLDDSAQLDLVEQYIDQVGASA